MGDANFDLAKQEWDIVEEHQKESVTVDAHGEAARTLTSADVTTMLVEHVRTLDIPVDCPAVQSSSDVTLFTRIVRYLFGPVWLDSDQADETRLAISLSHTRLHSLPDEQQMQLLASLYFNLLDVQPSSRFGSHWQKIGFQGLFLIHKDS